MEDVMSESGLARYLNVSEHYVWLLRVRCEGPPARESVFGPVYRRADVDAWLEAQRRPDALSWWGAAVSVVRERLVR